MFLKGESPWQSKTNPLSLFCLKTSLAQQSEIQLLLSALGLHTELLTTTALLNHVPGLSFLISGNYVLSWGLAKQNLDWCALEIPPN